MAELGECVFEWEALPQIKYMPDVVKDVPLDADGRSQCTQLVSNMLANISYELEDETVLNPYIVHSHMDGYRDTQSCLQALHALSHSQRIRSGRGVSEWALTRSCVASSRFVRELRNPIPIFAPKAGVQIWDMTTFELIDLLDRQG